MSSESSSNLNLQQLQDFLFDQTVVDSSSQISKGFDFNGLWQNLHVPSTNQDTSLPSSSLSSSSASIKQTNTLSPTSLSDLIGDITPAVAAVVVANTEESPLMDTPFLDDSCMNTPFTPALFTPNPSHFQNLSPYCSPQVAIASSDLQQQQQQQQQQDTDAQGDVQIAKYLKNDVSWQASATSATTIDTANASVDFSTVTAADLFGQTPSVSQGNVTITPDLLNTLGDLHHDPSQLLSTPAMTADQLNNASSDIETLLQKPLTASTDFLFPPLPSEKEEEKTNNATCLFDDATAAGLQHQQQDFSTFDASALFDNCLEDLFLENNDFFSVPSEQVQQQQQQQQQNETIVQINKRKHTEVEEDETALKALAARKVTAGNPFKRIKLNTSTFDSKKQATKANKINQNERRFKCHLCDAIFSRRYNLGTHIKTHDKNRTKAFFCQLCDRTFDRKHDLSRHISTVHNGERAFACTECTSTFSRKDALARHRVQKHSLEP